MLKSDVKYQFGDRLRELRERKGLTMKAIANEINVSESLISQIERNKVSPSIDTLFSIADALEADYEYIFQDYRKNKQVDLVRKKDRNNIVTPGVTFRQLTVMSDFSEKHAIEAFLMEIKKGEKKGAKDYGHAGKEFGFILSGEGVLEYGTEEYLLKEGDSISFSSDNPHILRNTGNGILRAIWVISPPRMLFVK